jgi:hypothetical protein
MLKKSEDPTAIVKSEDRYFSFPALARLENGDILMAFRSARNCYRDYPEALNHGGHPHTDQYSEPCLARSVDGGRSWTLEGSPRSKQELAQDHAQGIGYQDVGLTPLADGRVMLSIFRWMYSDQPPAADLATAVRQEHLLRGESDTYDYTRYQPQRYAYVLPPVYTISDRTGKNWTAFKRIDVREPGTGRQWGLATRNGGVLLDDNTVGWPFYYAGEGPQSSNGCHLLKYDVAADTWAYGALLAASSANVLMEEPLIHRHPDGSLVGLYRTTSPGYMFANISRDNGATWSPATQTRIWGHPFSALTMSNKDILLAYGYRREPFGIRMSRLAGGDIVTFDPSKEMVVRDDAVDDDIGYPSLCFAKDHAILLAYYYRSTTDGNPIRYIAIERWE